MKRFIVIIGMPGAGKDTQAERLAAKTNAVIIKTGDIARDIAKADTEVAAILQEGGLIPDSLVNERVEQAIANTTQEATIIFDGFPRREQQARWLDGVIGGDAKLCVYYLRIAKRTAEERLSVRGRADDQSVVIKHRLEVFERETAPVLSYYQSTHRLVEIDGEPSPNVVEDALQAAVKDWLA